MQMSERVYFRAFENVRVLLLDHAVFSERMRLGPWGIRQQVDSYFQDVVSIAAWARFTCSESGWQW